ncbi:MAG: alpha/beta hydrolase [Actinobacteria bacterium]|nr:alpha/beta hydrolase [Actinomycetota bacterium]
MQRNINVRGHELFTFQWSKRGEALVILHGGLSHSDKVKKYLLPAVKRNFKVFAYDRTGHGRTGNQKGSIAFNFQTKELIAFLEDVVKEPAHLIGVSDGAIIALMAAISRPELVRSVVSIGGNTSAGQVRLKLGKPEVSAEAQAEHDRLSPDAPSELIKKVTTAFKVWKSEPNIPPAKLTKIKCPVLVLAGDDDVISAKESEKIYQAITNARLAIVPGASHAVIKEKTDLVQALLTDFYAHPDYPLTKDPISRISNQ